MMLQEETGMNILLVYPEFPDTFWSFKHALKFVRKRASTPPLGLLTVAAMLPNSWELRLVDLNVAERPLAPFLADLRQGPPQRVYSTTEYADVSQTPTPLWHLMDLKRY